MALTSKKPKPLPIGVDLGSSTVKMVQMATTESGLRLLAAGSANVPQGFRESPSRRMDYMARSIRSLLKTRAFKSTECVISLPAEMTFILHMKVPKVGPEELTSALEWGLQGKLPYPVEDAIVRHLVAGDVYGDGEAKQEVIVIAASKKTVDDCLAMSRRSKLDVVGLSVEPCAIVDCFARLFRQSEDTRTTLYVDIGQASTQVVLAHGSRIAFARNLPVGGRQLDSKVAEGLGISLDEAWQLRRKLACGDDVDSRSDEVYRLLECPASELTKELTQCMRYHESVFPNQAVEQLVFLGGQANDKRFCQTVARQLNLAAHIGDPLVQVAKEGAAALGTGLDRSEAQPDWAVAVGLSLGAADAA